MKTSVTLAAIAAAVLLCWGGYQLHWYLAKHDAQHQYDVNTNTQQFQAGIISDATNDANGWISSQDPGQKNFLQHKFCAEIKNLTVVPDDISYDAQLIGCTR